jgi:hypothetical protein
MKLRLAAAMVWLAAAFPVCAQRTLTEIVVGVPSKTDIKIGRDDIGDLYTWNVTDFASPYYGLKLVWLVIDDDETALSVEKVGQPDGNVIAILSGGDWMGRKDSGDTSRNVAEGLTISRGSVVQSRWELDARGNPAGGMLIACGNDDDVQVIDAAAYRRQYGARQPCAGASVLQTDAMLLRNGRPLPAAPDAKSNRLAIGSDSHKIYIAGAFHSLGTALSLADFTRFLELQRVRNLSMLDLVDGCSAELIVARVRDGRFGCHRAGFKINQIVLRYAP